MVIKQNSNFRNIYVSVIALLFYFQNRLQDLPVLVNRHHVSPYPSFNRRPHTWKVVSDSF